MMPWVSWLGIRLIDFLLSCFKQFDGCWFEVRSHFPRRGWQAGGRAGWLSALDQPMLGATKFWVEILGWSWLKIKPKWQDLWIRWHMFLKCCSRARAFQNYLYHWQWTVVLFCRINLGWQIMTEIHIWVLKLPGFHEPCHSIQYHFS